MTKKEKTMELSSRTIAIVTIVILIGIMLYSGITFKPKIESSEIITKEEPLVKNKELKLRSGEEYRYGYIFNNTKVNITYGVWEGDSCTIIRVLESVKPAQICIDKWGNDRYGYNTTYKDQPTLMFNPWMLALHPSWRWNTSTYMVFDNTEYHMYNTDYRVMRTENYNGHMSYVVSINSSNALPEYQWIDVEKRIVLRVLGENYEVVLAEESMNP